VILAVADPGGSTEQHGEAEQDQQIQPGREPGRVVGGQLQCIGDRDALGQRQREYLVIELGNDGGGRVEGRRLCQRRLTAERRHQQIAAVEHVVDDGERFGLVRLPRAVPSQPRHDVGRCKEQR
jgi:hypothetical protein